MSELLLSKIFFGNCFRLLDAMHRRICTTGFHVILFFPSKKNLTCPMRFFEDRRFCSSYYELQGIVICPHCPTLYTQQGTLGARLATHIAKYHAGSSAALGPSAALPPVPNVPLSMRQIKTRTLSIWHSSNPLISPLPSFTKSTKN